MANGNVEQSKKLIQLALVVYGSIELFTGAFAIRFVGDNHSYLILFPACVFTFGILAFLPEDLFAQNHEWLTRSLKKVIGWSLWAIFIWGSPYLLGNDYFQKQYIPFNPHVWNNIGIWIGSFFACIIFILLLGKLLNWLHFRFSNMLTKEFQKFAQHCSKNKEMRLLLYLSLR